MKRGVVAVLAVVLAGCVPGGAQDDHRAERVPDGTVGEGSIVDRTSDSSRIPLSSLYLPRTGEDPVDDEKSDSSRLEAIESVVKAAFDPRSNSSRLLAEVLAGCVPGGARDDYYVRCGPAVISEGRRQGCWIACSPDGTVSKGIYLDGKRIRDFEEHSPDRTISKGSYSFDGKREGCWVKHFRDGRVETTYHPRTDETVGEGPVINGETGIPPSWLHRGSCSIGDPHHGLQGCWIVFSPDGTRSIGTYVDGKQIKHFEELSPDGTLSKGSYSDSADGKREGCWVKHFRDGRVETIYYQ